MVFRCSLCTRFPQRKKGGRANNGSTNSTNNSNSSSSSTAAAAVKLEPKTEPKVEEFAVDDMDTDNPAEPVLAASSSNATVKTAPAAVSAARQPATRSSPASEEKIKLRATTRGELEQCPSFLTR